MALSGIEIDPAVTELFNGMKLRSTHKYAIFKIEKKKSIVLDVAGDPKKTEDKEEDKESFKELFALLKEYHAPRYVLYDFGFTSTKEGRKINKLAFIFWCPDNDCKIGDKMIYASSKDTIKKTFTGLSHEFQANDDGDFDYDTLSDEVEKKA